MTETRPEKLFPFFLPTVLEVDDATNFGQTSINWLVAALISAIIMLGINNALVGFSVNVHQSKSLPINRNCFALVD